MNHKEIETTPSVELSSCSNSTAGSIDSSTTIDDNKEQLGRTITTKRGLKILFLFSDTGGGHRASAESLGKQFEIIFPGSTYHMYDPFSDDECPRLYNLPKNYQHLSNHPLQWKIVYHTGNLRAIELIFSTHLRYSLENMIRNAIKRCNPDVVISVHPILTNVPLVSCQKISEETGRHLPIYTVVTDLGGGHSLWFCNGVDKLYVPSEQILTLAKMRGKVPDEKLVKIGLPIRHDFSVQSKALGGDRTSEKGKMHQKHIRSELGLTFIDRRVILCMGGGEGVGSLSEIVNALYVECARKEIHATILVICGRNEKLKNDLEVRDWDAVVRRGMMTDGSRMRLSSYYSVGLSNCWNAGYGNPDGMSATSTSYFTGGLFSTEQAGCFEGTVTHRLRKILSYNSIENNALVSPTPEEPLETDDEAKSELPLDLTSDDCLDLASFIPFDNSEVEVTCVDIHDQRHLLPPSTTTLQLSPPASDKHDQIFQCGSIISDDDDDDDEIIDDDSSDVPLNPGHVNVIPLGFVNEMAKYMVAADVLVTKAGPGSIAEAASVGLPVMLTSFLPGQEDGNVDFVVNKQFGCYCPYSDPNAIAKTLSSWLLDDKKLQALSRASTAAGAPDAASQIARCIGNDTFEWRLRNDQCHDEEEAAPKDALQQCESIEVSDDVYTTPMNKSPVVSAP